MQARYAQVGVEPDLQAACLDHHLRLLGRRQVRGSRGQDSNFPANRLRLESRAQNSRRGGVVDHPHAGRGGLVAKRGAVVRGHPADQALAHPLSHRDDQPSGIRWGLSRRQHHFGYASA